MKKILAILVALTLVLGIAAVFAEDGDLTADESITITGLEKDDEVTLYKVIKWVDGEGWALAEGFEGCTDMLDHVLAGEDLTKDDFDAIAAAAKEATAVETAVKVEGTSYTKDGVEPGMYYAAVAAATSGVMYNPLIVSADYTPGGTNEISTSESIADTSIAKKDTVTVEKEEEEPTCSYNVGDEVSFTITTNIPVFSSAYTNPAFAVKDTLSAGLELTGDVTVSAGDVTSTVTKGTPSNGFTVEFDSAAIAALTAPQEVTITYKAILTETAFTSVNEEENEVVVEFSNDPTDEESKNIVKDETREYTFTIDGSLFGDSSYKTGELVKVGVDAEGNPVESMKELSNKSEHAALSGAVFGLYTDSGCTELYTNDSFDGQVTTAADGTMEINGLKAGTYYLKEISAPAGYIKDPNAHTIVIDVTIEDVDVTETVEGIEVTYSVPTLKSYTITVDGNESEYTMTLDGPSLSSVTPGDSSSEINNVKGVELPSTGGIGTTIFYVVGGLLVAMAVVLLVTKRRMAAEK